MDAPTGHPARSGELQREDSSIPVHATAAGCVQTLAGDACEDVNVEFDQSDQRNSRLNSTCASCSVRLRNTAYMLYGVDHSMFTLRSKYNVG
jgi:hypothetical protein